jgi:hypothetical protein
MNPSNQLTSIPLHDRLRGGFIPRVEFLAVTVVDAGVLASQIATNLTGTLRLTSALIDDLKLKEQGTRQAKLAKDCAARCVWLLTVRH